MFIDNDLFFIHIPKNGGTYINNLTRSVKINTTLLSRGSSNISYVSKWLFKKGYTGWPINTDIAEQHLASLLRKHASLAELFYPLKVYLDHPVKFIAVIRDPLERFYSLYRQTIKRQNSNNFHHFELWCDKHRVKFINADIYLAYLLENSKQSFPQVSYIDYSGISGFSSDMLELVLINDLEFSITSKYNLKCPLTMKQSSEFKNQGIAHYDIRRDDLVCDFNESLKASSLDFLNSLYAADFKLFRHLTYSHS